MDAAHGLLAHVISSNHQYQITEETRNIMQKMYQKCFPIEGETYCTHAIKFGAEPSSEDHTVPRHGISSRTRIATGITAQLIRCHSPQLTKF